MNAGAALDAKTQAVFRAVWLDGLGDLSPEVLRAAFQATLRACKFWPVKVADIREHVSKAESNAAVEAAERAWERVLELRRRFWNPDMLGGFSRGMPKLSERFQQAARAAGVFREVSSLDQLHVWAKKRFVESFIAYGNLERDGFLLPEGEIKNLLAGAAQAKALPAPEVNFSSLHERGLRYADQNKLLGTYNEASRDLPTWEPEKRREIEAELQAYGERFKAAQEKREPTQ